VIQVQSRCALGASTAGSRPTSTATAAWRPVRAGQGLPARSLRIRATADVPLDSGGSDGGSGSGNVKPPTTTGGNDDSDKPDEDKILSLEQVPLPAEFL
jgi:hypothetical protein